MDGFNYCMECGAKLGPDDKFCSNCGTKLKLEDNSQFVHDKDFFLKYKIRIEDLSNEYDLKMAKAIELIKKQFDPSENSYSKFMAMVNDTNNVFYNNVEVTLDIMNLASKPSFKIKSEIENKINVLNGIIDKLEDLIDELIIRLADKNKGELDDLSEELTDLINSVKEY